MTYTIRNLRPCVLHIPDAAVRLSSGQATLVETLSPQMLSLQAARALDVIPHTPAPSTPAVTVPRKPAPEEKKAGKTGSTPKAEAHDDAR